MYNVVGSFLKIFPEIELIIYVLFIPHHATAIASEISFFFKTLSSNLNIFFTINATCSFDAEPLPTIDCFISLGLNSFETILPVGLGCRDSLRLEMGYCLYGNELNEQTTTIEAGLSWITKHETSFIGSKSMQDNLPSKKLIALISEERAIPRSGYKIFSKEKKEVGVVTSGGMSPCLKKGIALAYVDYEMRLEKEFLIGIRDNFFIFEKTKLPFYKNGTYLK